MQWTDCTRVGPSRIESRKNHERLGNRKWTYWCLSQETDVVTAVGEGERGGGGESQRGIQGEMRVHSSRDSTWSLKKLAQYNSSIEYHAQSRYRVNF